MVSFQFFDFGFCRGLRARRMEGRRMESGESRGKERKQRAAVGLRKGQSGRARHNPAGQARQNGRQFSLAARRLHRAIPVRLRRRRRGRFRVLVTLHFVFGRLRGILLGELLGGASLRFHRTEFGVATLRLRAASLPHERLHHRG